jgi:hypothetical protein
MSADAGHGQLRLLLGMRWQMLREPKQRRRVAIAFSLLPLLIAAAIVGGQLAPDDFRFNFALLAPTVYASFFALTVISPASSAGGSELFPADQLVAYPVRDRTVFASTVLLAPANLAWLTSFLLLIAVTSYTSALGPMVGFALLTAVVYAAAATLTGQAIAWWLEGVRQRRAGRWTVRLAGGVFILVGLTLQLTHRLTNLLDQLPTKWVAISAVKGSQALWWPLWGPLLAGMAATGLVAFHLGARGCRWTQGQVSDGGLQPESRPVRRRTTAGSDLLALMQIDRASVWRSASLRRGALVMAILPGAIAAITEPSWDSLVLLTGLVAAGSGLLFGVNAFGMDGPGALTLEGLPMRPELRFWAKAATILEFSGLTVAGALVVGAVRADSRPTATQLVALIAAALVTSLAVASFCMKVSVTAPHRSELRGRRDTPAPPGAMIGYSARLAWRTTWIAMALSLTSLATVPWFPFLLAVPMAAFAGLSLVSSSKRWLDTETRSRVIATVASG